ncbi:MAG: cobalamin biosynthesis protein CobW [Gammaproteobacteria bacterium]|nr:cobalamin biosynthesis protein CobW [Gammaproteobacteria bacterium]
MSTSERKIPATIITGFLGAGKTSAIRHLLENADGRRIALIINEFGDLGVDGEIVRGCAIEGCAEDDVVELANGCICCTVADDFLPTMQALLAREAPPDHIVIETSGLALPKPLVRAFGWPEVRTRVTVDGVVTVVDAPAVAEGLFANDPEAVQAQREADEMLDHESPLHELFEEQLGCADMVLVNKSDLLEGDALDRVESEIARELRPGARVLRASHGRVAASVLLGLAAAAEDDLQSRRSHHDDGEEHDHDDFASFVVDLPELEHAEPLLERIVGAVRDHGILRIKGFAAVAGKDMRLVVQGVGPRLQHYFDRDWRENETRATRLVIIGERDLDFDAVRASLTG